MKKIETKIFENFRTFGKDDEITFKTDLPCRACLKVSGNYILLEGWIRICKSCLTDWTKKLEQNYLENVVRAKREEE